MPIHDAELASDQDSDLDYMPVEYEDFAFDLVALFEVEPIMIPPKWSTDQNFLAAANHIQDCMKQKFQSKADELLEQRKAKGKQVNI